MMGDWEVAPRGELTFAAVHPGGRDAKRREQFCKHKMRKPNIE